MRFQTGHAEVQAEGFGQTASMGIAASAKAFKGLIDGLYSRKIEAAQRELGTNCFDAHKMVASIAPFHIHLPTPLKPTFWVRDFGPGMSHEFMMTRYTVMFESTKDGTNEADASLITPDDQVGCLGLGRMSFFAYTDACAVTVWQDGEARFYSVYMGAKGVPSVSHAGSSPSDEPDGVKVEFAVKPRDIKSFENAAIRVFKGFPVLPTGLPIDVREAISEEPLEMGTFWKAYSKSYLPDGGFYARQGCVLYPIDLTQIDDRLIVTDSCSDDGEATVELSENYARFMNLDMTIVMDFPIGSIDFDLSRERLAYNDRTVAAIRDRWEDFVGDLDEVMEKNFNAKAAGFDRFLTARSPLFESLGSLFQQTSFFREAGSIETFIHELLPASRGGFSPTQHAFKTVVEFRDEDDKQGGDAVRENVLTYNQRCSYQSPLPTGVRDAIFVYIDGNKRYMNARVHYHLRHSGKRYGYVFEKGCLTLARWREMGCPPIVRSSELIAPPREIAEKMARRAGGGGGTFDRIKIIDGDCWRAATDDDETDDCLFVQINRGMIINPSKGPYPLFWEYPDVSNNDVTAIHNLLVATGGPSIAIINTRSNDKPGRWDDLPLFYSVLDTVAERLSKKQIGQCISWLNDIRFKESSYHRAITTLSGRWGSIKGVAPSPLTALGRRFYLSQKQTDVVLSTYFNHLYMSTNPVLMKIVNDIIDIATRMGMEVLPPWDAMTGFSIPLLNKVWEEKVQLINGSERHHSRHNQTMRKLRTMIIAA